jgi:hypothetical protein
MNKDVRFSNSWMAHFGSNLSDFGRETWKEWHLTTGLHIRGAFSVCTDLLIKSVQNQSIPKVFSVTSKICCQKDNSTKWRGFCWQLYCPTRLWWITFTNSLAASTDWSHYSHLGWNIQWHCSGQKPSISMQCADLVSYIRKARRSPGPIRARAISRRRILVSIRYCELRNDGSAQELFTDLLPGVRKVLSSHRPSLLSRSAAMIFGIYVAFEYPIIQSKRDT